MSAIAESRNAVERYDPLAAIAQHVCHPDHVFIAEIDVEAEDENETLEDLASKIQAAHFKVGRASGAAVEFAATAGRLLRKARDLVPDGAWTKWLQLNCDFRVRTARDYLPCAEAFDKGYVDRQHAADSTASLRGVLAALRRKTPGAAANDDGPFLPWDKARQRFLRLTEEVVQAAALDPKTCAWLRNALSETINTLSRY